MRSLSNTSRCSTINPRVVGLIQSRVKQKLKNPINKTVILNEAIDRLLEVCDDLVKPGGKIPSFDAVIDIVSSVICLTEEKKQRPSFDEYFMRIAFDVSLRSEDPDIIHGAVITTKQNHIIGTGYNATIRGSDKSKIPFGIRDKKRPWMIHAEENAILNCTMNPLNMTGGAKIYVTGTPCVSCLQRLINFGITEIIHAKRAGTSTENEDTDKMRKEIVGMSPQLVIREMEFDPAS